MPSSRRTPPPDDFDPANDPDWMIHEKAIIENLRSQDRGLTPDQIRFLCNMSLLAAHERKVTRVPMTEFINLANDIQKLLGDIEAAAQLMLVYQQEFNHPAEKLMEVLNMKAEKMTHLRYQMSDKVELLMECRPKDAKVS